MRVIVVSVPALMLSREFDTEYQKALLLPGMLLDFPRRLIRTCPRCGYVWAEACVGKVGAPPQEVDAIDWTAFCKARKADDIGEVFKGPDGAWFIVADDFVAECNGQGLSTEKYPRLFAHIGYTCGGEGERFCVPDMRPKPDPE